MANSKISGLSAVTTLGATDELVLAVSGATKKITGANLKTQVAGYEFGIDTLTATVNATSTTESSGTTIISCASHTFDGGSVLAHLYIPTWDGPGTTGASCILSLFESTTQIARFGYLWSFINQVPAGTFNGWIRFTPTAGAHTYTVTSFNSGASTWHIAGGASGTGAYGPAFVRFIKE